MEVIKYIMNSIDWSQIITPIVLCIITAYVIPVLLKAKTYIQKLIGKSTYDSATQYAKGIFVSLEQAYGSSQGATKKSKMTEALKKKFPSLTDSELLAINKTVWASMDQIVSSLTDNSSLAKNDSDTKKSTDDSVSTQVDDAQEPESDSSTVSDDPNDVSNSDAVKVLNNNTVDNI